MIRFYQNKTPQKGEIVIVSINSKENSLIKCKLLEYDGIEGVICRVDVSRNSAKIYNALEPGKIIPVICCDVNVNETRTYIDLNYVTMDKQQIAHYKERYEKILKIINVFSWIAGSSSEEFDDIEHFEYLSNPKILKMVQAILSDSLYQMTKDEICELFFDNVYKLHEVAKTWKNCLEIPAFMEKLIERFPKPKINLAINLHFQTNKCLGVKQIKMFFDKIKTCYTSFDSKVNIDIVVLASPLFRLVVNSDNLIDKNYQQYFDIINGLVNDSSLLDCPKIISCNVETSSGPKNQFKVINVFTEIVEESLIDI